MLDYKESVFQPLDYLLKHDISTFQHSIRVGDLLCEWGKTLSFLLENEANLFLLGTKHDVGKLTIPSSVLQKDSSLSDREWEDIRNHPLKGYEELSQDPTTPEFILLGVLHHHENYDGTGYPYGLKGDDIPIGARLVRIVDSYDVLTHSRTYKDALPTLKALEDLQKFSGSWYDPFLLDNFIDYMTGQQNRLICI